MSEEATIAQAEKIVSEIKRLFGASPLLSTEDEVAYYELMKAMVLSFWPADAFAKMLVNDLTAAEWRKNGMRRQQSRSIDSELRERCAVQAERRRLDLEKKERRA